MRDEAYPPTVPNPDEGAKAHSGEPAQDSQLGKRFGDDAYAMEELIAELGAALLCVELSITGNATAGSRAISRTLARRPVSRQESDLHGKGHNGMSLWSIRAIITSRLRERPVFLFAVR